MRGRILLGLAVLGAAALGLNYLRPVPAVAATSSVVSQKTIAGSAPTLPWPSSGSAAVGVSGLGKLADSGNETQIPTASVAKVMTALVVMHDKPLGLGQTGPSITVTDDDVQAYQTDLQQKQSVVAVQAGEVLTQYQALQAMLIPSGNNIAELLARWDAGSVPAFIDRMNERARALGLAKSKFADPAGADPATVSTASDLLALAMVAMTDPVIAQIVSLPQVQLPVAGVEYNVNAALGQDGIVGIKTGSGLAEGANFLFAATMTVTGHQVTIFGCVMGQPTLGAAFTAARALIRAMQPALTVKQELARNQAVGGYDTPWGTHSDLISTVDVPLVEWPGMILRERLDARVLSIDKPVNPGTPAGTLHVVMGDYELAVPVVTASQLYPPGRFWRLTRLPNL